MLLSPVVSFCEVISSNMKNRKEKVCEEIHSSFYEENERGKRIPLGSSSHNEITRDEEMDLLRTTCQICQEKSSSPSMHQQKTSKSYRSKHKHVKKLQNEANCYFTEYQEKLSEHCWCDFMTILNKDSARFKKLNPEAEQFCMSRNISSLPFDTCFGQSHSKPRRLSNERYSKEHPDHHPPRNKSSKVRDRRFFNPSFYWSRIFISLVLLLPSSFALPIRWEISPYGDCSMQCGRGVQSRSVVCRRMPEGVPLSRTERSGMRLPEIMCPSPKPPATRACSLVACAPEWTPGPWSECSRTCGRGVQLRESRCNQRLATGTTEPVPVDYCSHIRPLQKRKCAVADCPARYIVKQWTDCSVTCGKGIQLREVMCMRIPAGGHRAEEVSLHYCTSLSMPVLKRQCKERKCQAGGSSRHTASRYARIITENRSYVQRGKESKIRLVVGMKAFLLPRATVIIRCPVLRFPKSRIYWKFNGTEIEGDGSHITLLSDNSLRIRYLQESDVGRYTCVAGDAEADLILNMIRKGGNPEIAQTNRGRKEHLDVDIDLPPLAENPENVLPDVVKLSEDPFEPITNIRDYLGLTNSKHGSRSSELLHATGGEIVRPSPVHVHIQSDHAQSGARSPRPLIVRAADSDSRRKIPPATADRNIHHTLKISAADPSSGISQSISPEQELLLLLEAAGVDQASEKAQDILSMLPNISSSETSEKNNLVEILAPPDDVPVLPVKFDETPKSTADQDYINDLYDMGGSKHQGFVSIPDLSPADTDTDQLIHIRKPARPQFIEIPHEILSRVETRPQILSQPTVSPMQLENVIVTYVGGTLIIVSDAESVTLLCEASGYPRPLLEWFKDDEKIYSNESQFILPDHSLRLLRPTRTDGGTYTCKATNSIGSDSARTVLNVAMVPRILSTMTERFDLTSHIVEVPLGSIITARLGATVRISCPVEGFPEPYVKWDKDVSGLGENMQILPDNTLEIQPTTTADQGVYSCEASNPVGTDYQASALVLLDPPHLSEDMSVIPELEMNGMFGFPQLLMTALQTADYRIKAGTSVIMGCPVAGFPEPKMTWTFNGRPLQEFSHRLDYQLLLRGKVLQLPEVDSGTTGVFACHARNGGGNLTTTLALGLIEYSYIHGDLTECSASCGGKGTRQTTLVCVEDGSKPVHDWYCTNIDKPTVKTIPCNRVNCPPSFHTGAWSPCSNTCGKGKRTRTVTCRVRMSDESERKVQDSACMRQLQNASQLITEHSQPATEFITEKPTEHEICTLEACPTWKVGPWTQCSRKCSGRGTSSRVRRLYCVNKNGTKLPKSECKQSLRPKRRELCQTSRCEPVWIASRWSMCSRSCGKEGIQTRILSCVFRGNRRQRAGTLCSRDSRPPITAPCNRISCNDGKQTSSLLSKVKCVDKSRYCSVAKSSGLCAFYKNLCCRTCR